MRDDGVFWDLGTFLSMTTLFLASPPADFFVENFDIEGI